MTKIIYHGRWPDGVQSLVSPFVDMNRWLLPTWCHEVGLHWENDMGDNVADCCISYQYRSATIRFGPKFLDTTAGFRQEAVVHEFLHLHTLLVFNHARHYLTQALEEKDAFAFNTVMSELDERHESMTCDLALCIASHMPRSVPVAVPMVGKERTMGDFWPPPEVHVNGGGHAI